MNLQQENFIVNILLVNKENEVTLVDVTESIDRFTANNSSPILGENNMKYKITIENLDIPIDTKIINLQVIFKINNQPDKTYLFDPIINQNGNEHQENKDSFISYSLYNNNLKFIWIYFIRNSVEKLVHESTHDIYRHE
jgi:hypothetical protein|uniref:Uncharacterized protein n=1 Tax=viral metagenome TaxID=1070528 RepID=A0A6C0IUT1_9ZZZZ